jgi:hypothetical protein
MFDAVPPPVVPISPISTAVCAGVPVTEAVMSTSESSTSIATQPSHNSPVKNVLELMLVGVLDVPVVPLTSLCVPTPENSAATADLAVTLVVQLIVMLVIEPAEVTGAFHICASALDAKRFSWTFVYVLPRLSDTEYALPPSSEAKATKTVLPEVTLLLEGEMTRLVPAVLL